MEKVLYAELFTAYATPLRLPCSLLRLINYRCAINIVLSEKLT
jgi:hypothetical protein